MNLSTLMKFLAIGEVSNLYVSDKETGTIAENWKEPIRLFIQEALNKLYGQYRLKTDSIYIDLVAGKTQYKISSKHLMGDREYPDYEHYLYKPQNKIFDDDILNILEIVDSKGCKLPINSPEKNSVYTLTYNEIQIPDIDPRLELEVIYSARHPTLSLEEDSEIELPESLIPAIRAYVAYLVHSNINTELSVANAQKYLAQFNAILKSSLDAGIIIDPKDESNEKFDNRGFI